MRNVLPVFNDEVGDTWIYGTGSDPWKVAAYRTVQRIRTACVNDPQCDSTSYAFHNFSRLLLKASMTLYPLLLSSLI
jgi:hypothetical protein